MRVKTVLAMLVLAWSVSGRAMAADPLAVLPVSGINVHSSYLEAAQDLFRQHLAGTGAFQAVLIPGQPPSAEWSAEKAVEAGKAAGAKWVLATHITRLAARATVRVVLYDVGSGSASYSDHTEAASPDDLNAVLIRLARSVAWRKPVGETADIESVTEKEEEPLHKKVATNVFGARINLAVPFNSVDREADDSVPGFSIFWLYDARWILGEGAFDFLFGDASNAAGGSLGAYYPYSKKDFTPYAGGGLFLWNSELGGGTDEFGIAPYVAGGALLGRLSTIQFRADARYFLNTFREKRESDSDGSLIHGLILSLGIGF